VTSWQPMLEELVRQRYGALVGRARLLTPSQHDAEDLVHDALVATFKAHASFGSVAEAEGYVRKAIVSRFVDQTRRTRRETAAMTRVGPAPTVDGPDAGVAGPAVAALSQLSPRQRACVVLRHLEGFSVAETAALLGLAPGSVKRYTSDAVAALNEALGTQFITQDTIGEEAHNA
jgi:DNA-directed RNA polymerase specialized sigma24 family protein